MGFLLLLLLPHHYHHPMTSAGARVGAAGREGMVVVLPTIARRLLMCWVVGIAAGVSAAIGGIADAGAGAGAGDGDDVDDDDAPRCAASPSAQAPTETKRGTRASKLASRAPARRPGVVAAAC